MSTDGSFSAGNPVDDGQTLGDLVTDSHARSSSGKTGFFGGHPAQPVVVMFLLATLAWMEVASGQLLGPEIGASLGFSGGTMIVLGTGAFVFGLLMTIPLSWMAERSSRVRLLILGTVIFSAFAILTTVIPSVWYLYLPVRCAAAVGLGTVLATHNSLLADYYDMQTRPRAFGLHGAALPIGFLLGFTVGGQLGERVSWRVPFLVVGIGAALLIPLALRLREPKRGYYERLAMGLSGEALEMQEAPPSLEEAHRIAHRIGSLRRVFYAIPFLAIALGGFGAFSNVFYTEEFGLGPGARGWLEAIGELGQIVGIIGATFVAYRVVMKRPSAVLRLLLVAAAVAALSDLAFALSPNVATAAAARFAMAAGMAGIFPLIFTAISLAVPARARASGFSLIGLYILLGVPIIAVLGLLMENIGTRWSIALIAPMILLGGYIASTAHKTLDADILNVWASSAARTELLEQRKHGRLKQLMVRNLDVKYGDVQILFGVNFEVDQGEIVALLGTNGAGKSTLLKAITGVVEASGGAIILDGRDITSSPPHEISSLGIAMVPGGQGVFPSLTVAENLKVASWHNRSRSRAKIAADRVEHVLTIFPVLRERMADPAANLSGGQQQMLALGMAFLSEPKLLVIDELSLGLAPVIVEQLLDVVRAIRDQGTTVILVEQSVNVALTLAETAYFMEKGEMRFHGPTAELLERPDVLRSVFLEGAAAGMGQGELAGAGANGRNGHDHRLPAPNGNGNGNGSGGGDFRGAVHVTAAASSSASARRHDPFGSALELRSLSVRFGGIQAVNDVSFSVAPGEIVGIIGPNGAGKTTLFDLISGFSQADTGRVMLAGRDVTRLGPDGRARRGLGRSFQDARLFPALTVEDTIKVAFERFIDARDPFNAMLRMPIQQDTEHRLQRRVDELIELMGIESFRSKFVRELSTGSRRVVDLACVLAHHPSVVLLDEPSSGIAQRETEALGPLVRRIRDTLQASIVIIEHDMPLVTSVSDRLVALDQGRVVVEGSAEAVLNHPEVVASYLGSRDEVINRSGHRVAG